MSFLNNAELKQADVLIDRQEDDCECDFCGADTTCDVHVLLGGACVCSACFEMDDSEERDDGEIPEYDVEDFVVTIAGIVCEPFYPEAEEEFDEELLEGDDDGHA